MTSYIGLIRKDTHSDLGVDISDLPGCVIAGATLDAARHIAQEALELHIGSVVEDGEDLPAPSSLKRSWPTQRTPTQWPFSSPYLKPQTAPRG
jgi:predicted RNase H-like HicB family nuclease